jgi:hypothetical protein
MTTTLSARPVCQHPAESAIAAEATRQAASWIRATSYDRCGCGEPWMPGDLIVTANGRTYCCPTCARGINPC